MHFSAAFVCGTIRATGNRPSPSALIRNRAPSQGETIMTARRQILTERSSWKALEKHYSQIRDVHLRQLFAEDRNRGERMTAEAIGIYLDYSKHRINDETIRLLLQLAEESELRARIEAMF